MHQHGHIIVDAQNQISKIQLQISEKNHLLINTLISCVTDVQELSFWHLFQRPINALWQTKKILQNE